MFLAKALFRKTPDGSGGELSARVAPGLFPPEVVVEVKALACELPATFGLPISRWSSADLAAQVRQ